MIKNLLLTGIALVALAVATPLVTRAQVQGIGGTTTITGTGYTMALDTNAPSIPLRHNQFTLTMPNSLVCTGFVGQVYFTYNTNSIAGITNGALLGTFSATNFTSTNVTTSLSYPAPPGYTVFVWQLGTNNPGGLEIYGP